MNRPRSLPSTSLKPIGMPRLIEVHADRNGMPLAVVRSDARSRRRSAAAHVERIEEMWRLTDAWWRETSQTRTYYHVVLEGGVPLTIYRDDSTNVWAEQPYTEPRT
jgi:hypothetical protein